VRVTRIAIQRTQLVDQLRALSAHLESVREDERTFIAREIHDQLGQSLTALKMDLAWLGRRATESETVASSVVLARIEAMSKMADGIIGEVRRISASLRPGVLDDLGLLAAIEWQGEEYERRTGIACKLTSNVGNQRFDSKLSTAVFRIFQEALTNVARHAAAKHVSVNLERHDHALELVVRDDGKGIAPEAATDLRSLGLLGMRERARSLGGTIAVGPDPTGGTTLRLHIPLD
jgi:signal transduction histidine kinase